MKKFPDYLETLLSSLVWFTPAERKGIILIVIVATGIFSAMLFRPEKTPDQAYLSEIDRLNDSIRTEYYRKHFPIRRDSLKGQLPAQRGTGNRTPRKSTVYIELNRADSAKLRTVKGIGPVISRNITAYRKRLGGFVRKEQLKEVWGVTEENFEAISAQFFIDSAVIQKIDINFAPANQLRAHPYFTESMVLRITEARKLKGGWNQLRELVNNDILLPDEAEKVAAYVVFGRTE